MACARTHRSATHQHQHRGGSGTRLRRGPRRAGRIPTVSISPSSRSEREAPTPRASKFPSLFNKSYLLKKASKFHEISFFFFFFQIQYFIIHPKYVEENPTRDRQTEWENTEADRKVIKRILMFALLLHGSLSGDLPVATLSMNT